VWKQYPIFNAIPSKAATAILYNDRVCFVKQFSIIDALSLVTGHWIESLDCFAALAMTAREA
jgi:hypothetical protein